VTDLPALTLDHPAFLQDPALGAVLQILPESRLVGGCVRDALASRPVSDIDLATPRRPEEVILALEGAGLRAVPTGLDHGTITAVVDGRAFEITTLRRDVETDGRHASVAFTADWRLDAARRDFTMNAMSMRPDGAVFDYFGGIDDLAAGRVRFVGDPATRIREDYLRVLRFFRFHARYGRGAPDEAALAAIRSAAPQLARLSAERVWGELVRILSAPDPTHAVRLMDELGVLGVIVPEGVAAALLARLVGAGAPANPVLRMAALLAADADAVAFADRLRLSGAERERLAALRQPPFPDPAADEAALRRMLADTPHEILLGRAWLAGDGGADWAALRGRISTMPAPIFPLQGRDVLELGVQSGPRVGALLREVRAWWLSGGCIADADACRRELARLARG
jgi:poly(A) polymerase